MQIAYNTRSKEKKSIKPSQLCELLFPQYRERQNRYNCSCTGKLLIYLRLQKFNNIKLHSPKPNSCNQLYQSRWTKGPQNTSTSNNSKDMIKKKKRGREIYRIIQVNHPQHKERVGGGEGKG